MTLLLLSFSLSLVWVPGQGFAAKAATISASMKKAWVDLQWLLTRLVIESTRPKRLRSQGIPQRGREEPNITCQSMFGTISFSDGKTLLTTIVVYKFLPPPRPLAVEAALVTFLPDLDPEWALLTGSMQLADLRRP